MYIYVWNLIVIHTLHLRRSLSLGPSGKYGGAYSYNPGWWGGVTQKKASFALTCPLSPVPCPQFRTHDMTQ